MKLTPIAVIIAALAALTGTANAQLTVPAMPGGPGGPVIPSDGSPVSTQGSFSGYDNVTYRVQADPGETMTVNFQPDFAKCYFNVTGPDGKLVYWSGKGGNAFTGTTQLAGEYTIKVFLKDNSARKKKSCNYNIAFSSQKR